MIHSLDLFSLRLSSTLASFAFGLVFLAIWRGRREDAYLLHWSASSLLYAVDLMAFQWAGHPSLALGCVLYGALSIANILAFSGLRQIESEPPFAPWMAVLVLTTMGLYAAPAIARAQWPIVSPSVVPIGRAIGLIVSMTVIGTACIQAGRRSASRGAIITGFAMLAYIPGYLAAIAGELGWKTGGAWLSLIPMLSDQLLLGVLNLGLLAVPVERAQARLRDAALRDPLTGCWNRAGLARFSSSFAHHGAAAIAIDIDHFKQLNDRFGHAAGDEALVKLVAIATEIAEPLRGEVARLGGDEFAVLLPAPGELEVRKYVSDLKTRLAAGNDRPTWTISVGISSALPESADCSDALKQADAALYRAKWKRRERIVA